MSDKMFTANDNGHAAVESKIPVPSSPAPLRRHNSLRVRGEAAAAYHGSHGRDQNRGAAVDDRKRANTLIRAGSFMERGEKRTVDGGGPPETPGGGLNFSRTSARIRSLSLSLSGARGGSSKSPSLGTPTPNHHPVSPARGARASNSALRLDCWDGESVSSVASSLASCDHAPVARNGTTFSGRSMKYVFHCNQHSGTTGDEYLTPTQRAHRQVKKLKCLLHQARRDLDQKDSDIVKLTKEVVELRLYKAALNSPEDRSQSNSSDAVTVRENTSEQATPEAGAAHHELTCSISDSGHFDDGTDSSIHSQESGRHRVVVETSDKAVSAHMGSLERSSEQSRLIVEYERRIQELVRTHEEDTYHLKQRHNDKVEELLQRITEINARYWELVPEVEAAKEKIRELEAQLEDAVKKLEEQERRAKRTYLKMYAQGQETTARAERDDAVVMEVARTHPNRVSVPELLNELQVTKNELDNVKDVEYASSSAHPLLSAKEALSLWVLGARKAMYRQLTEAKSKNKIDPEITLQFLRSAVYYFLTDKENSRGHLRAIESILGFSPNEIANIDRALS